MKRLLLILLLSASVFSLFALDPPPLKGRINDYADLLSSSEEGELSRYLEAVERDSGVQIALLTIPSLEGDSLESFSYRTARYWKLGSAGNNNGLLLLIALEERKIRIEVGYGLEGTITDSLSGFVIRNHIAPYFKRGDFAGGISDGLHTLGAVITGDVTISPEEESDLPARSLVMEILRMFGGIIFFFLFFFLRISVFGRRRRTSRVGAGLYTAHRMHTHSSGFSSGGFSGGGFSGGGGSFGGGGASGGW